MTFAPLLVLSLMFLYWALRLSIRPSVLSLPVCSSAWCAALLFGLASIGVFVPRCREIAYAGIVWGCVIGVFAFLLGVAGPLIFWPDAAPGPLLGFFITGPVGFAIGTAFGLLVSVTRSHIPWPKSWWSFGPEMS